MSQSHPCDICRSTQVLQIPCLASYGLEGKIVVCGDCGFVYVPSRRSEQEIADSWSYELFGDSYTSAVPYITARLFWVAKEMSTRIEVASPAICDVGCGEGTLLEFLEEMMPDSSLLGVDPSPENIQALEARGLEGIVGTAQSVANSGVLDSSMDVVSLTWTLENSSDCRAVLRACNQILKPGGLLVLATGSRILVPFKKPLDSYVAVTRNPDTHAFRWSRRSLGNLLRQLGFAISWENSWRDSDWMMLIARKERRHEVSFHELQLQGDDPLSVVEFFQAWHDHTLRLRAWETTR